MRLRLALHVFSLHLRTVVNYRVDFWVNWLLGLGASIGVAYFLWDAIFTHRGIEQLGGFTFKGMMLYYVLAALVDKAILGGRQGALAHDIYEGTLNRYLLYPVNLFGYKLAEMWASSLFAVAQGLLTWIAFAYIFGLPADAPFSIPAVVMGLGAVVAAAMLYLIMIFCIDMVAFWADNVWSLSVLLTFIIRLLGGTYLPLSLFPQQFRSILEWLPFSFVSSFPIRSLMGQVGPVEWSRGLLVMAAWMLVFGLLARLIWKKGSRYYSGVGI